MAEVKELARISISETSPKEVVEWIDRKVESRIYSNSSPTVEVLILEAMLGEEKL